jgi:hypothetical protein
MPALAEAIHAAIVSRQSVGIVLILAIAVMLVANRGFVRDVAADPAPGWRLLARFAAAMGTIALVWVTLFDDWLQLVVEPYRLSLKWEYQRILLSPIEPEIRLTSVVLIGVALLAIAFLAARHMGGYLMQLGVLLVSTLAWIPLFIMNQRVNALVIQGAEADASVLDVLGLALFWLMRMTLGVVTIAISAAAVTMLISLVATVILDLLHAREPRVTREADAFFGSIGNRVGEEPDVPIHSYWKPIRRPL